MEQEQPAINAQVNNPGDMVEGNEHVIVTVRRHWIGAAGIYFMAVLLAGALAGLAMFVLPGLNLSADAQALAIICSLAISVVLMGMLVVMIYIYHKSNLTLTDQSLVQLLQLSLFNKKISRLSMSNVEDVNVEQRGIISNMFGYGTLTVQTAGEEDNFVFKYCPTPNIYAERILEARQAYARAHQPVL